jgi:hypothetical protein
MVFLKSTPFDTGIAQKQEACEPQPTHTIPSVESLIEDAIFGPTAYSAVSKLNRAAEYCSIRAMIAATQVGGAQECSDYAEACLLLQRHADSLDAYLVESFLESGGAQ